MYTQDFDTNVLYQGDVINDILFIVLPDLGANIPAIERGSPPRDSSERFFNQPPQIFPAISYITTGIIISQNCDIDRREFLLVAPVFPVSSKYASNSDHLIELRKQRVNYEVHLPPTHNLPESLVDLQIINAIKKEKVDIGKRIAVLSNYGRSVLQECLRNFLGRMEIKPYIAPGEAGSDSVQA